MQDLQTADLRARMRKEEGSLPKMLLWKGGIKMENAIYWVKIKLKDVFLHAGNIGCQFILLVIITYSFNFGQVIVFEFDPVIFTIEAIMLSYLIWLNIKKANSTIKEGLYGY
jgi:hypothetical protein